MARARDRGDAAPDEQGEQVQGPVHHGGPQVYRAQPGYPGARQDQLGRPRQGPDPLRVDRPGHACDRAVSEGALRDLASRPGLRPSRHLSAMGGIARGLLRRGSGRGTRKAHHAAAGLFGHHPDRPAAEGAETRPGAARRQRHRQEHPAAGAVGDADGYTDLDAAGGYLRPARPGGIPASRTVGARRSLRYRRLASQRQGQGDHLPRAAQHQPEEPSPAHEADQRAGDMGHQPPARVQGEHRGDGQPPADRAADTGVRQEQPGRRRGQGQGASIRRGSRPT